MSQAHLAKNGMSIYRRHSLMLRKHEADTKNLPGGLRQRKSLLKLAESDAVIYFESVYGTEPDR